MNTHRKLILALAILLLILACGWIIFFGYFDSKNKFLAGRPPADIENSLFPRDIDISKLKPPAIRPQDPLRYGNATSVASLIEYGDYQCTACKQMHELVTRVVPKFGGKIRLVWRDMPITEANPDAMSAAIFSRCAMAQGKFWEAHDALMKAPSLGESVYAGISRTLGLSTATLIKCRQDPATRQAIEDDVTVSRADGVNFSPFFFVGTKAIRGAVNEQQLQTELQALVSY